MAVSRNKPSSDLPGRLAAFLAARVPSAQSLCVGLSGGRDSVVLTHALVTAGFKDRVSALHVHHGLSPYAEQWAVHCRSLCLDLGIPLQIERVQVGSDAGFGLEAAAREARYAAFARSAADCMLLAHHQDDQGETVLFNLLRGCGLAGARGMRSERQAGKKRILRPFLDTPAGEIAAYAQVNGLRWIEDESNADTGFSRNFLRHQVMQPLAARFPAAPAQLAKAASHFAEAELLLGDLANIDWAACAEGQALRLPALRQLSAMRIRNLLRWRLQQLTWCTPAAARI
ncbi:MAG TPA: tRNA lysidine(34) synthetase TilS, partial [Rhodocyclaceae bacterium]|nr:tRNA lysidine(34) synthetase TilS [Rhodocyclaceae bacterium]